MADGVADELLGETTRPEQHLGRQSRLSRNGAGDPTPGFGLGLEVATDPLELGHQVGDVLQPIGTVRQEAPEFTAEVVDLPEDGVAHRFLALGILGAFGRHLDAQQGEVLDDVIVQLLLHHVLVQMEAGDGALGFGEFLDLLTLVEIEQPEHRHQGADQGQPDNHPRQEADDGKERAVQEEGGRGLGKAPKPGAGRDVERQQDTTSHFEPGFTHRDDRSGFIDLGQVGQQSGRGVLPIRIHLKSDDPARFGHEISPFVIERNPETIEGLVGQIEPQHPERSRQVDVSSPGGDIDHHHLRHHPIASGMESRRGRQGRQQNAEDRTGFGVAAGQREQGRQLRLPLDLQPVEGLHRWGQAEETLELGAARGGGLPVHRPSIGLRIP